MGRLSDMPNIGEVIEKELNGIGVHTQEQLMEMGSKDAFVRIRLIDNGACLHKLYALQGAIEGKRYTQLAEDTKQNLKQFFKHL